MVNTRAEAASIDIDDDEDDGEDDDEEEDDDDDDDVDVDADASGWLKSTSATDADSVIHTLRSKLPPTQPPAVPPAAIAAAAAPVESMYTGRGYARLRWQMYLLSSAMSSPIAA